MKCKSIFALIAAIILNATQTCQANIDPQNFFNYVRPFIGADFGERNMGFEQPYGSNIFKKREPQYDIYGGVRLCRYVGVGVGYEKSGLKNRQSRLVDGDTFLGLVIGPGEGPESHDTEVQISGRHIDLMGFYPVIPSMNVELFGSIGLVKNHLKLQDIFVAIDDIPLEDPIYRNYDEKKTVSRVTIGLQTIFFKHVGIRGMLAWEETSRFENLKPIEVPDAVTIVNLKNSIIYNIGLFVIL
jgi:hypothetical protein